MHAIGFFTLYNFGDDLFAERMIIFLADTLPYLILIGVFVFLLFHHEVFAKERPKEAVFAKWREILFSFIVGIFAWFAATFFKNIFGILRPFDALGGVENLLAETGYAFPSGHATFYMALAFSIYFSHKKAGLVLIFLALIIGTARVMAGVHYPVDILGGYVLGIFIATLFNYIFKK